MTELIHHSIELIRKTAHAALRPAAMLSFGKDSMVMASLIQKALHGPHALNGRHFPTAHTFPIPVIYHRDPWFPAKHDFAERMIRAWGMQVHDFLPLVCGIKSNESRLELVARYPFGEGAIDIPKNVCEPEEYPRRDFLCGLYDWVFRPKMAYSPTLYPFDVIYQGHKNCEVDPFEGPMPLKSEIAEIAKVKLVFPLREWSTENIWDYIDEYCLEYQQTRYHSRSELEDKWYNNDYTHACTRCIDPRNPERVFCPKLNKEVNNLSQHIPQLREEVPYIQKEKENANPN